MAKIELKIDKMLTIDSTGMPCPPNLKQLLDKDVKELYTRDPTKDKRIYIAECGVIYYVGDPKSPSRQKGLNDEECLKEAIINFNLPKDYQPDRLVLKLINKYYEENITPAGKAVEIIQNAIHNEILLIQKYNKILTEKLNSASTIEEIQIIDSIMKSINSKAGEIPELSKKLEVAKENLINELQDTTARGGGKILSSMNSEDYLD